MFLDGVSGTRPSANAPAAETSIGRGILLFGEEVADPVEEMEALIGSSLIAVNAFATFACTTTGGGGLRFSDDTLECKFAKLVDQRQRDWGGMVGLASRRISDETNPQLLQYLTVAHEILAMGAVRRRNGSPVSCLPDSTEYSYLACVLLIRGEIHDVRPYETNVFRTAAPAGCPAGCVYTCLLRV